TSTLSKSTRTVCGSRFAIGPGRSVGSREISASTRVCAGGVGVTRNCPSIPACLCPGTLQKYVKSPPFPPPNPIVFLPPFALIPRRERHRPAAPLARSRGRPRILIPKENLFSAPPPFYQSKLDALPRGRR